MAITVSDQMALDRIHTRGLVTAHDLVSSVTHDAAMGVLMHAMRNLRGNYDPPSGDPRIGRTPVDPPAGPDERIRVLLPR